MNMEILWDAIKKDKYWLPTLNWILFISISGLIALLFLGETLGITWTILSTVAGGLPDKHSPHTMQVLSNFYRNLQTSTHLAIFIVLMLIISGSFCISKIRKIIWETIQNLMSGK